MVDHDLEARGIENAAVLAATREVPREDFVPPSSRASAYDDRPLPIGRGQTISQPYVVALMLEAVAPGPDDRLLDVGTGSGYSAALASRIVGHVCTIERHEKLSSRASSVFARLGYTNISVRVGDGSSGWPEAAPFSCIVVSAAGPSVPASLVAQLGDGGRLVMPVESPGGAQRLVVGRRRDRLQGELELEDLGAVAFVPLVGEEGFAR